MSRLHDAARTEARTIGVSVILSAGLRRLLPQSPEGPQSHALPAGAVLADLLAAIGVDPATDLTAAVDGELAEGANTPSTTGPKSYSWCRWRGEPSQRRGDHKKCSER